MQPRLIIPIVVAAVATVLAATFVRIQPSGRATLFRDGHSVAIRTRPIYLRPLNGERCSAAMTDRWLTFDSAVDGITATSDEFPLRIRFAYEAPKSLPAEWPAGDWCTSFAKHISNIARKASQLETADALIADRRAASERVGSAVSQALERDGIRAESVSARAELPSGFERLRAVSDVALHARNARPVIFIGLDGADWQLLDGYTADGTMPNLKRLIDTGSGGVLETDYPPLSPLVWTTMMTGVGPLDHGILDFARFNPYTHEKEAITSDERRAPAIWNVLTWAGKLSSVFGLWATYAAEPVHGVNVSDRLFTFLSTDSAKPAGVVWPPSRQPWSESMLASAERAVDAGRLREYLPSLTDSEFASLAKNTNPYAEPPSALRRILVETEVYHRLSDSYLHERITLPDLTVVYLQGTDTIGHVFAPFGPPKQTAVSQADYDRYHAVPAHYFREIDDLLGREAAVAEERGAILMIASDHGFFWGEGRPTKISSTATATAAKWHRKEGIYLLRGPGIPAAPRHPFRGSVRQVYATLLALAGMPPQKNGREPLPGTSPPDESPVDYAARFSRALSPPPPQRGARASEEIAKLKALGYIGTSEATKSAKANTGTKTAGAFNNEGLILRNEHRPNDALAAFENALTIDPNYASAQWNESETLFLASKDPDRSDALLISALENGLGDAALLVIGRSLAYRQRGQPERSLRLLDRAVTASQGDVQLKLFRGHFRTDAHNCAGALADFQSAEQSNPLDPIAYASAAVAQLCLGDQAGAQASIERSLQLDPNQPMLRRMLTQ